jgi:hypothetical protein
VYDLLGSPAGTRIGYLSASPGGADLIQDPLRKIGVSRNPKTGEWTVRLAQSVSPAFRRLTGRPYLPVIVRIGSRELVFAFNFQKLASHAAAIGSAFSFSWVSLHLFGSYARLGQQAQAARNPLVRTTLHASVAARPCSDPTCETLGPSVHDSALIVLPRELTVLAPGRAFYGQPVRFYGTGEPGEFVTIAYEHRPGSAPPCTTANFQSPPDCAPRFRPALRKLTEQRTRVAVDGTWSLMLPLRSSTPVPGPLQLPEERSVSGRYVAVEYSGRHIWGPWPPVGGSFSVVAEAPRETVVALDRPMIELARRGRRDVVTVSVRGADRFVRVVVSFRGAVVAAGAMNDNGVFTATFAAPLRRGAVEAQVSTEGAIPSTASREAPVARA